MLSRMDFYDLEEDMKSIKIYELRELSKIADSFITYINSINNSQDIDLRISMIKKAEEKAREMIQLVITKINPDLNWIINLDGKENDSYKKLTDCLGFILDGIEKQKELLKNNLLNKDFIRENKITNQVTIDFYSSTLSNLVSSLVYNPLKEACFKFLFLENTDRSIKKFEGDQVVITGDDGKSISIHKDRVLFWFLVFSYLFRSSQVIGFFSQEGRTMPRTLEFKEIQRLKQRQFQYEKQMIEIQNSKEKNKSQEVPTDKNLDNEEEKQIVELKPTNLYFPYINGADHKDYGEDQNQEESEDSDQPEQEGETEESEEDEEEDY
jgi:hypothetical protein